jgi:hypothetical protein
MFMQSVRNIAIIRSFSLRKTLICLAMMLCVAGFSFAEEQKRQFTIYKDGIEPLVQAANAFMKSFNKDVQITINKRSEAMSDSAYLEYYIMVPPPPGSPPFVTPNKEVLASIGIYLHKPYMTKAGVSITEGPQAEQSALSRAFQGLVDILDDDQRHNVRIIGRPV